MEVSEGKVWRGDDGKTRMRRKKGREGNEKKEAINLVLWEGSEGYWALSARPSWVDWCLCEEARNHTHTYAHTFVCVLQETLGLLRQASFSKTDVYIHTHTHAQMAINGLQSESKTGNLYLFPPLVMVCCDVSEDVVSFFSSFFSFFVVVNQTQCLLVYRCPVYDIKG